MTPKEKASELVLKMRKKFRIHSAVNHHGVSKKCALIAVDEIIDTYHSPMDDEQIEYWQEVKEEVKKL